MKKIFKILCLCMVFVCAINAHAETEDSAVAVVKRTNCAELKAQIDELSVAELDEDGAAELAELKVRHRRDCSVSAVGRRRSGRGDAPVIVEQQPSAQENADVVATPVTDNAEPTPDTVTETETETEKPELTPEQMQANLEAGLCADGEKPNKFGCCDGETFRDLGNTVFACCKKDSDECFPPMK